MAGDRRRVASTATDGTVPFSTAPGRQTLTEHAQPCTIATKIPSLGADAPNSPPPSPRRAGIYPELACEVTAGERRTAVMSEWTWQHAPHTAPARPVSPTSSSPSRRPRMAELPPSLIQMQTPAHDGVTLGAGWLPRAASPSLFSTDLPSAARDTRRPSPWRFHCPRRAGNAGLCTV